MVFLCDTDRRFNRKDSQDTVLVHAQLGLGPKLTDLERRVEYPTLARNAIRLRLEREMLSEEMRLLYVALTRPKERLYISAVMKNPEARIEKLRAGISVPLAPEVLAGAASPVDWLLSAALADGERHLRPSFHEAEEAVAAEDAAAEQPQADSEALAALRRNLSFVYPFREAESLPSKLTATGLKGRREADEEAAELEPRPHRAFRMPDFARADKPATGTEKGIATHLVLQYMDFDKTESLEAIQGEIERLRDRRFLSDREAEAVDARAIQSLFASPLG